MVRWFEWDMGGKKREVKGKKDTVLPANRAGPYSWEEDAAQITPGPGSSMSAPAGGLTSRINAAATAA